MKYLLLLIAILGLLFMKADAQIYQDVKKYSSTYCRLDTVGNGANNYSARNNSLYAKTDSLWFKMAQDSVYHGLQITGKILKENTGASYFNYNNLGSKEIKMGNTSLTGGELKENQIVSLTYDSTYWQLSGGGGAGAVGATGATGATGSTGATGATGADGASNSIYYYQAETSTTANYPGDGHISWDNATQISATSINISHLSNSNPQTDIDLFLAYLHPPQVIIIQDQSVSSNYQKWMINATTTNYNATTDSSYWYIPVTLITSNGTGTTNFANNHDLFISIITPQDTLAWSINGNAGTDGSLNFIGTTDAQNLIFKTDNTFSGGLDVSGNFNTSFGILSTDVQQGCVGSTSFGWGAGKSLSGTANQNTSIGTLALTSMSVYGSDNTSVGYGALNLLTDGNSNTAVGSGTAGNMNSGSTNTVIGYRSMTIADTSNSNVTLGADCLPVMTKGDKNIAVGFTALEKLISANGNIAIGSNAGGTNQYGSYNTYLGYNAGGSGETRQAISLGYEAGSADNTLTLSDSTFAILPGDSNVTSLGSASKPFKDLYLTNSSLYLGTKRITSDTIDARLIKTNNLSDLSSAPTARTNLGLGNLSTVNGLTTTLASNAAALGSWVLTTTSTTLVDITGASIALDANSTYSISFGIIDSSSSTAGNRWAISLPTSSTGFITGTQTASSATATSNFIYPSTNFGTEFATSTNNAINLLGNIQGNGTITTSSTSGNFKLQIRKVTSGTAYIRAFYMTATKISGY